VALRSPSEVLTDIGGQFIGWHVKSQPVEVMSRAYPGRDEAPADQARIIHYPLSENERFSGTLREELVDHNARPSHIVATAG
jgi:hypothetical protein